MVQIECIIIIFPHNGTAITLQILIISMQLPTEKIAAKKLTCGPHPSSITSTTALPVDSRISY